MEKILDYLLSADEKIIKYGQADEKIVRELKMITSLYDYIDVFTDFYDREDNPYLHNWTDIEGMGYGWIWMDHEEKDWHKMMARYVSYKADGVLNDLDNTLYFVYEDEGVKIYHFIWLDQWREDVRIRFSNKKLHY